MQGRLYRYALGRQAFESPASHSLVRFAVYIGGLTDGLLACAYVPSLGEECARRGWALVQPILSSSYAGFGTSSLDRDAAEIGELLHYLHTSRGAQSFALIGHSTGCQNAVHFLAVGPPELRQRVRAAVLQAPVSDREAMRLEETPEQQAMAAEAEKLMAEGKGEQLLSERMYGFVPITASRYTSLSGRGTPDDLFSSDFTPAELSRLLGHLSTDGQRQATGAATVALPDHPGLAVLFCLSTADEYVPTTVDMPALASRFTAAAGATAASLLLKGANHNLAEVEGSAEEFVSASGRWLVAALGDAEPCD